MDLKSFSGPNFDPKKWINDAWNAAKDKDEKELFVTGSIGKLQLYMQQLNNALEETSTQVSTGMPRILHDAASLQQEGLLLRDKLIALEGEVVSVETATGHSIQSLQRIDGLKGKLESAAASLQEADKWAQLASSLEDLLEEGAPTQGERLQKATDLVRAMANSLDVLSGTSDYEDKRTQLEELCNRLEAALSPALVDAFTNHNAERSARYYAVFTAMGRPSALLHYWRRCEETSLSAAWTRALEGGANIEGTVAVSPDSVCGGGTADAVLRELYSELLSHCNQQVKWCSDVFGGKPMLESLLKLYSVLLVNVKPSPTDVVSAGVRRSVAPPRALDLLQDVRSAAKQFIEGIHTVLDSDIGKRAEVSQKVLEDLGLAVYAPLRQMLPRFGELQAQALAAQLEAVPCNQELAVDRARAAASGIELSGSWLSAAHAAARKLAGVACYPHLINAIESFLSLHCSRLRAARRQLEAAIAASRSSARSKEVTIDPTSLWDSFAPALSMLASAGELLAITENLQKELLEGLDESVGDKESRTLHNLELLLLNPESAEALKRFQTEDGAPLSAAVVDIKRGCRDLRVVALDIVFSPINVQLDRLSELPAWTDNDPHAADLPDYSFTPQEYITQIGQYLMTLPQHLEPFLVEKQRGPSLARALTVAQNSSTNAQPDEDLAWYFLNQVCTSSCELYCEKILSIKHLDALGSRKCATDIAYLCSVVDDLGASGSAPLRRLEKLLRASPQQYTEVAEGTPAKIVAAVRHLRSLPPTAN